MTPATEIDLDAERERSRRRRELDQDKEIAARVAKEVWVRPWKDGAHRHRLISEEIAKKTVERYSDARLKRLRELVLQELRDRENDMRRRTGKKPKPAVPDTEELPPTEEVLAWEIGKVGLAGPATGGLRKAGVRTVQKALALSKRELRDIEYVGPSSIERLEQFAVKHHLPPLGESGGAEPEDEVEEQAEAEPEDEPEDEWPKGVHLGSDEPEASDPEEPVWIDEPEGRLSLEGAWGSCELLWDGESVEVKVHGMLSAQAADEIAEILLREAYPLYRGRFR